MINFFLPKILFELNLIKSILCTECPLPTSFEIGNREYDEIPRIEAAASGWYP